MSVVPGAPAPATTATASSDVNGMATCSGSIAQSLATVLHLGDNASFDGSQNLLSSTDRGPLVAL